MKPVGSLGIGSPQGVAVLNELMMVGAGDGDFVEFVTTGTAVAGAFRCSSCGYGVTVQTALPTCPMCGGTTWEQDASSPSHREQRPSI
jgi:predicted RNA-binding Zn-ribbon protein involved in translation (DUF1610 family)